MRLQQPIRNEKGSVVITTMVILAVVMVVMSGVVSMKLTQLSQQSYKTNEAFRYLNVMEQMGLMIARARDLGKGGGAACTTLGLTAVTVDGIVFCLPGASMGATCITDESQKDASGASIKYCLHATLGLDTASVGGKDMSNVADLTFDIIEVKEKSMLERAAVAVLSPFGIQKANAGCSLNQSWQAPCTPDNVGGGSYQNITVTAPLLTPPPAFTAVPTGTASTSNSYASRANLDTWSPSMSSWSTSGTNNANEIFTPSCDTASLQNQYWLGCMSCDDDNVLCIDIKMCPPVYSTGTASCSQPYRQRIAVY